MYKKLFFAAILSVSSLCFSQIGLDKTKYIGLDEIKPHMPAYCLTIYEGTNIEKFPLEVISVVKGVEPGHDAILVKGLDPRFEHTGPVAGCSGSPVYIDGRMAGALAFGWAFSKDALYGVTPIEEMHRAGEIENALPCNSSSLGGIDLSKPIDLAQVADSFTKPKPMSSSLPSGASILPAVLSTTGLPQNVSTQLESMLSPMGFVPVSGMAGTVADPNLAKTVKFEPGGTIVVPLVDGDIRLSALGTVTDVVGDKVYGFGHSFLGTGAVELPVATGVVNTVVASMMRSFKFGSAIEVKGALVADESTAIVAKIGKKARTIPLTITIDRFNDSQIRKYNCQLANHEMMSPMMVMTSVSAAAFMRGPLPPDHTIAYRISLCLEGVSDPIVFDNISAGDDAAGMIKDGVGSLALLMNNPYKKVCISSIDFQAKIMPKSIASHIWSVTLADTSVKAGESLEVSTVIEPYLADKVTYSKRIAVPANLAPGEYELLITGPEGYASFLKKAAPQKFVADSMENMITAIRNIAQMRRDRLYFVLLMPPSGVTIESQALGDLPASKAMVLQDEKRSITVLPYQSWVESSVKTDSIVGDSKVVKFTVER